MSWGPNNCKLSLFGSALVEVRIDTWGNCDYAEQEEMMYMSNEPCRLPKWAEATFRPQWGRTSGRIPIKVAEKSQCVDPVSSCRDSCKALA